MAVRRQTGPPLDHYKLEHVTGKELHRLARIGPPWLAWFAAPVVALLVHWRWPQVWVAVLGAVCAMLLAAGSAYLNRRRDDWHGRLMAPASLLAIGLWLTWADLAGVGSVQAAVWFVVGMSGALYWSHWLHTHEADAGGSFAKVFANATTVTGQYGAKILKMEALPEDEGIGLEGGVQHPPGVTSDEFAKVIPNIEAAAGLPPGSMTTSADLTHAGRSRLSLSNPLLLDVTQPWPGPSMPGASILEPVRVGRYANGRPARLMVVNHSTQVMGKTGSGKSFGWTWNECAEQFTRTDAAVMLADATKETQTLGPLMQGLHRAETGRDGIAAMLEGIHRSVKARTRHLASRGLDRYAPNCGLRHLTVGLEEAPDIVELLDDEELLNMWLSDVKAGRSAGIRWLISLQRSTFDQLPTIVRAQLTKVCFGVEDEGDAGFGLAPIQERRNCHPELWGANHPGKCYAYAPGIPDDLAVMELRTYGWGRPMTDEGAKLMRAHCAAYPASARPLDDVTAAAMDPPVIASSVPPPGPVAVPDLPGKETPMTSAPYDPDDLSDESLTADLRERGSQPETIDPATAGEWDLAGDSNDDQPPLSPDEAMRVVERKLDDLAAAGQRSFGLDLWADVLEETGRSAPWLYSVMDRLEAAGRVRRRPTRPRSWTLGRAA